MKNIYHMVVLGMIVASTQAQSEQASGFTKPKEKKVSVATLKEENMQLYRQVFESTAQLINKLSVLQQELLAKIENVASGGRAEQTSLQQELSATHDMLQNMQGQLARNVQ